MVTCPASRCRADNDDAAGACTSCGTPLASYARVASHAAELFNRGLTAARARRMKEARDLFAAVVLWCPADLEARNAYALACFCQGDKAEARRSWEAVLARSSRDNVARRGMLLLDRSRPTTGAAAGRKPKTG
jgi:Flp pilus assembly protein TadD